jgi:hypothetical protein
MDPDLPSTHCLSKGFLEERAVVLCILKNGNPIQTAIHDMIKRTRIFDTQGS